MFILGFVSRVLEIVIYVIFPGVVTYYVLFQVPGV